MKYVLDASVAVRWVLPTPQRAKALKLRTEHRQQIHELIAPSHFTGEIASALTKAERQKLVAVGEARRLTSDIHNSAPDLYPYEALLWRAIDISSQTRSSLYDCLYVALAEREGCPMVTANEKLLRNLQRTFPFIISLASLP